MEAGQGQQAKYTFKIKGTSKVYSSNGHSDLLLHGLNEQRLNALFCDIVLVADEGRFPAHRNILAACSSYFNSIFTIGMQETSQKEVELIGTSSVGCKAVVDFIYSKELILDSDLVDYVLETAHLLQMWMVVDVLGVPGRGAQWGKLPSPAGAGLYLQSDTSRFNHRLLCVEQF